MSSNHIHPSIHQFQSIEKTKRLPISEPLQQDNELVYKIGIPAPKNDRYPLSYRDPEHGRKIGVELAQRPGPAPGPAKMKERGEEREKEEIPSDCHPETLEDWRQISDETIDETLEDRF